MVAPATRRTRPRGTQWPHNHESGCLSLPATGFLSLCGRGGRGVRRTLSLPAAGRPGYPPVHDRRPATDGTSRAHCRPAVEKATSLPYREPCCVRRESHSLRSVPSGGGGGEESRGCLDVVESGPPPPPPAPASADADACRTAAATRRVASRWGHVARIIHGGGQGGDRPPTPR